MPAYKDKEKGTWYASFYYEDWTGKKVKKLKRGFSIKRDALEWERTFLQQQTADLEMTFENFVALYAADMKGRIKENTWGTKEHTALKNRLTKYAAEYPDLCRQTDDDEQDGLTFQIDRRRIGIRLTAPYSEKRRQAASVLAKKNGLKGRV